MSSISNFAAETGPTAAGTRLPFDAADRGSFFGAGDGIELFTSEGFLRPPPPIRAAVDGLFSVAAAPFAAAAETPGLPVKAVGFFNPLAGYADAELIVEAFDTLSLALAKGLRTPPMPGFPLDAILLFESDLFWPLLSIAPGF